MPRLQRRRASPADVEALPEHLVGEIIHGDLVVSPRPTPRHAQAASALAGSLYNPFGEGIGGPGGWWILDEPELRMGIDPEMEPLVPDLAGWRVERMPELPETAWFSVSPDWLCEVLSPRTAATDRADKMPFYARAGVRHAWLIDPLLETLEVYRLDGEGWRLVTTWRGDVTVSAEPFDAVPLDLSRLWRRRAKGMAAKDK
jgi:Uma2 family endonuclease